MQTLGDAIIHWILGPLATTLASFPSYLFSELLFLARPPLLLLRLLLPLLPWWSSRNMALYLWMKLLLGSWEDAVEEQESPETKLKSTADTEADGGGGAGLSTGS